jgi:conjugative transfer signal peptidase TraF
MMTPTGRKCLLGVAVAAVALVAAAWLPWPTRLLYNPSDSAPRGWYAQRPTRQLRPGSLVFARLSPPAAQLAHQRGYLPQHLPLLKRIGGVGGQHVCLRGGLVRINGRAVALALVRDGANRPLTPWPGCRELAPDEVFLFAADRPASFDSRYFGPVARAAVLGEAVPLWTW